MIVKEKSERLQLFALLLQEGKGITEAGRITGFTNPFRDAVSYLLNPADRAKARRLARGLLDIEGAPAAYCYLRGVMLDPSQPARTRVDVAKFILAHALPAPKAREEDAEEDKHPSEMTNEELQAFINRTDDELRKRGKLIDVPAITHVNTQALDSVI